MKKNYINLRFLLNWGDYGEVHSSKTRKRENAKTIFAFLTSPWSFKNANLKFEKNLLREVKWSKNAKLYMNIYNKHIITVNINGKALANPNLLAFAYVISLLEGKIRLNLHLRRMTLWLIILINVRKDVFSSSFLIQNVSH
jgi:hypothetical protein